MSWFGSIVNSLKLDDDDDAVSEPGDQQPLHGGDDESAPSQPAEVQQGRGVKEDLDEITKTLTRQFWGVASFLAPPPQSPTKDSIPSGFEVDQEESAAAAAGIGGIRSDFAEIGGRFKSGITKLSGAKAVSDFSKIASNILQFGLDQGSVEEYQNGSAIGVTEEVAAFAKNISMHPETWLDFPLADDDQEQDDFDMSDAQQEHALAIEQLVPELSALRFELCPEYMSEGFFWKIYFVLVHPRLDKHDADLISTPQILETRAMLTRELQNRRETAVEPDILEGDGSYRKGDGTSSHEISLFNPCNTLTEVVPSHSSVVESAASEPLTTETDKLTDSKDIQMVDKSVIREGPKTLPEAQNSSPACPPSSHHGTDEDDGDDWLKEEPTEAGAGSSGGINIPIANDEDVSFSDLEEENDTYVPAGAKKATYGSDSSTKSPDWVQLSGNSSDSPKAHKFTDVKHSGSPNKESNDWLNVEDIDEI